MIQGYQIWTHEPGVVRKRDFLCVKDLCEDLIKMCASRDMEGFLVSAAVAGPDGTPPPPEGATLVQDVGQTVMMVLVGCNHEEVQAGIIEAGNRLMGAGSTTSMTLSAFQAPTSPTRH